MPSKKPLHNAGVDPVPKKEYSAKTQQIVKDAQAWAAEKKAAGWTREDFAKGLQEFFNEAIPLLAHPRGDWIANIHFDTLKNPAQQHLAKDHDLGPPKRSRKYTEQQLLDMGYCGLYMKKQA